MGDLLKDVERIYDGIQHLQIQPTKTNTAIMLDTMQTLEKVYSFLQQSEKGQVEEIAVNADEAGGDEDV